MLTRIISKVNSRYFANAYDSKNQHITWESIGGYPPNYDPTESNLTPRVWSLTKRKLWENPNHPISIIKNQIHSFLSNKVNSSLTVPLRPNEKFIMFDKYPCITSTQDCFDNLLVPINHVSRRKSDTYYINKNTVLRTHTSGHDVETLKKGHRSFLVFGIFPQVIINVKRGCI